MSDTTNKYTMNIDNIKYIISLEDASNETKPILVDETFAEILNDPQDKYQYSLKWCAEINTLFKSLQNKIKELQKYEPILNDIDTNGVIIFTSSKPIIKSCGKGVPFLGTNEVPISLDMFTALSNTDMIEQMEKICKDMNNEYIKNRRKQGLHTFLSKKICLKETEDIFCGFNVIFSTYRKAIQIEPKKMKKVDDIYRSDDLDDEDEKEEGVFVTLRYEGFGDKQNITKKFCSNFVSLPAFQFLKYMKEQNMITKIKVYIK